MKEKEKKLILAASNGRIGELIDLIKGGIDVNAKDEFGSTALLSAVEKHYTRCVKALLKAGASLNVYNKLGKSAILIAKKKDYSDIVKLLAKAGAIDTVEEVSESEFKNQDKYSKVKIDFPVVTPLYNKSKGIKISTIILLLFLSYYRPGRRDPADILKINRKGKYD